MSTELEPRPTQNPDSEGKPASADAPVAAALRHVGFGFLLGFLLCAILAGALLWQMRLPTPPPIVLHPPPTVAPTSIPLPTSTPLPTATPGSLFVFISGGVQNPGMYELPANARVGDALARAGGLLTEADPALINQAQVLFDGAQIHVPLPQPTRTDAGPTTDAPGAPAVSGTPTATASDAPPSGISGNISPTAAAASNAPSGGPVNINTATLEEIMALPGIGPSKAEAIVAERPFDAVEDLERVSGIGPSTIETLAPLVTVSDQ